MLQLVADAVCYPVAAGLVSSANGINVRFTTPSHFLPDCFLLRMGDYVRAKPFVVIVLQFLFMDLLPFKVLLTVRMALCVSVLAMPCAWAVRLVIVTVECHVSSPILRDCTDRTFRLYTHPLEGWM